MSANYPSDLTDGQWQVLRPLLPPPSKRGRPRIDRRAIIDAILYVVRTGCQWRQLPLDFPKWKTVYTVFWRWRKAGLWERLHDTLRRRLRQATGKKRTPRLRFWTANRCGRPKVVKNAATMRAKRSPVANDIWPSTRWGWYGWWSCMAPS